MTSQNYEGQVPAGSGKTTLLSILAGSTSGLSPGAKVNGQVLVQDEQGRDISSHIRIGLVPQNDYLLPTLTVFETLWYSCRLRLCSRGLLSVEAGFFHLVPSFNSGWQAEAMQNDKRFLVSVRIAHCWRVLLWFCDVSCLALHLDFKWESGKETNITQQMAEGKLGLLII